MKTVSELNSQKRKPGIHMVSIMEVDESTKQKPNRDYEAGNLVVSKRVGMYEEPFPTVLTRQLNSQ